ncbi:hypothetical protein N0V90_002139 [Kalmusia sp. IMI 367209]|nr:hypothetical protein N0V90_002139 [Kalmusia sp. IMI 367209]
MNQLEPLAIVGLACRFPQDAEDETKFWRMLVEGRCAMTAVPEDRFNINSVYHPDQDRLDTLDISELTQMQLNLRGGHFLKEDLASFDAPFFSISAAEASAMDPQQKGMLECSFHALENAGLPLQSVSGSKTGVFTGSFSDDHKIISVRDMETSSPYVASATSFSMLANRLSWWYNFKGPSMNIDTACSSGLVALHLACQSLRNGESSMALVGGSSLLSSVEQFLSLNNLGMLSPSSLSYSFDARANGYARGEGFSFVVVKTLSSALRNHDTIRAVIRATGINQDGRTPSLTAPSPTAQVALIRDTYRLAGIDPKETTYVEAHGTGTPLGDPIEANAIGSVFGTLRDRNEPVYVGAVKSNIGHLEGGSGLAGLIKTILILEKGIIPPNTNYEKPNPKIDLAHLNIRFPVECTRWPTPGLRRASVNSFGFGGTNAHVVLEDSCNFLRLNYIRGVHSSVDMDLEDHRELQEATTSEDEMERSQDTSSIDQPDLSQPICTALQIALVDLLSSLGVTAHTVVGHSSGEIASAYAAGLLSAMSAYRVAYFRGIIASSLTAEGSCGGMLAVGLSLNDANEYLCKYREKNPSSTIVVACSNSDSSVTMSGDTIAVDDLTRRFNEEGIFVRKLRVPVAYHSPHMDKVAKEYESLLGALEGPVAGEAPTTVMISTVDNCLVRQDQVKDPLYWIRNLRSPVLFREALTNMLTRHVEIYHDGKDPRTNGERLDILEIGPHSALMGPCTEILSHFDHGHHFGYERVLKRKLSPSFSLLKVIGKLFTLGYPVNLMAANNVPSQRKEALPSWTDLPQYPFDRAVAQRYNRPSLKSAPASTAARLDLLGSLIDQNGPPQLSHQWRKLTRISETPWVAEHVVCLPIIVLLPGDVIDQIQVSDNIVYPAAGMICMAIEAVRQISNPTQKIKAYRVMNAEFSRPILIQRDESVESRFELRPGRSDETLREYSFSLCTLQQGAWIKNCSGAICECFDVRVDEKVGTPSTFSSMIRSSSVGTINSETSSTEHSTMDTQSKVDLSDSVSGQTPSSHSHKVASTDLYDIFASMGLRFGSAFQSLTNVTTSSDGLAWSTITPYLWTGRECAFSQNHLIHPITLDGMFQTALAALVKNNPNKMPTAVPTKLKELYLERLDNPTAATTSFGSFAKVTSKSERISLLSATARANSGTGLIFIDGLEVTEIDIERQLEKNKAAASCYHLEWKADIDFLRCRQTPSSCLPSIAPKSHYDQLRQLFSSICMSVLGCLDEEALRAMPPYLDKYLSWMREHVAQSSEDPIDRDTLSATIARASVMGEGLVEVGSHLRDILLGKKHPLEVVFKSNLAERFYRFTNHHTQLALKHVAELIFFKQPGLKVLEVGAGTGSTTELVLEYATMPSADRQMMAVSTYDFTDISPAFFTAAKTKFGRYSDQMKFSVLDCSRDPIEQGFAKGSYDLIIAANVLHATPNLNETLRNMRRLLKAGGKLVLLEMTNNQWVAQTIFGLLPGWWLSTDEYRNGSPCISSDLWGSALLSNGFSGVDVVLDDSLDEDCHLFSVIVSTAVEKNDLKAMPEIMIVADFTDEGTKEAASTIQKRFRSQDAREVNFVSLAEASQLDLSDKIVISLLELFEPFLISISKDAFVCLRTVLSSCKALMWLRDPGDHEPAFDIINGLLRVLRSETGRSGYVSFCLQATDIAYHAAHISTLVERLSDFDLSQNIEQEFRVLDGKISIQRAIPAVAVNAHLDQRKHPCNFDPNATYVIAGGFGGLARSTCRWMVRRGARHLLLLSRSGPSSQAAQDMILELTASGARIESPVCDISNFLQLENVFQNCTSMMPPIKGCMQGVLTLQDAIFEHMSHKQWTSVIDSRVKGTRILYSLLGKSLDFFILFSSATGILGMAGQANYAASNTFLDGFATRYGNQALPIISLDLGYLEFAGTIAESAVLLERFKSKTYMPPISEATMLSLLDYYCHAERLRRVERRQTLIGVSAYNNASSDNILNRPIWRHLVRLSSPQTDIAAQSVQEDKIEDDLSLVFVASSTAQATGLLVKTFSQKLSRGAGNQRETC